MNLNLDSLKTEIASHLKAKGFIVFHGFSRSLDGNPEIEWDTAHYPDYNQFIEVATQLGIKLMVLHYREFSSGIIDRAIDGVSGSDLEYKDQKQLEQRLRELAMYDGFTCMIEMSFDFGDTVYLFELRTEWYSELNALLEELDFHSDIDDDDRGEDPLGGYYSKN